MKKGWIIAGLVVCLVVVAPAVIPPLLGLMTIALPGYCLWVCFKEPSVPSEEQLWLLNRRRPEGQKVGPGDKPPSNWRRIVEEEEIYLYRHTWEAADVLYARNSRAWHRYVDNEKFLLKAQQRERDARKEEIRLAADALFPRDSEAWLLFVSRVSSAEADDWLLRFLEAEPDGPVKRQMLDLLHPSDLAGPADQKEQAP